MPHDVLTTPSVSEGHHELLTTREAASWLGITVRMVHHYTRLGRLEPTRRVGRAMLFSHDALRTFSGSMVRKPRGSAS